MNARPGKADRGIPATSTPVVSPAEERARYTQLIVRSSAPKKLIVAGPGTGKTFTFHQALTAAGGRGLALTFINNLVRDLKVELADTADAYTFHGFCKHRLHQMAIEGLTSRFNYYPPVLLLIAQDMEFFDRSGVDDKEIERCLHNLDDSQGVISAVLRIGTYYDTVSHTDSVYRVLQHLERNRNDIPNYPLVVVDEYQDFSLLETRFIGLLAERNSVLVAGDDDQALYGFKHASANYIRALAQDQDYTKFELPYCSRCTEVIINAVNDVLRRARTEGLLAGRLAKPYSYYPPDKGEDSERHPSIIHAHCTVERRNAPYIGRYVATRIAEIPEEEIRASREGRYPTALVIGPVEFVRRVHPILLERYPNAILKESSPTQISILDGYRYLHRDERSRLGWRIVLYCDPPPNAHDFVRAALRNGDELHDLIPVDFRERHLRLVRLAGKVMGGEILTAEEKTMLKTSIGQSFESISAALCRNEEVAVEADAESSSVESEGGVTVPSVICTSLLGAKGLSASRVFIVGLNNGHLPRNPSGITDDEVCRFIVGLSRTRKQCYLISCARFGNVQLLESVFLVWIRTRLVSERVDRRWIQANAAAG